MSENNGENKIGIQCPKCTQQWSIPWPKVDLNNSLIVSSIIIPHAQLIRCQNNKCRQPFVFGIQSYTLVPMIAPVNDEAVEAVEGSRITKPVLEIVDGIS